MNANSSGHYLSIDDVLATNEKIPCKFINQLPKMGFLDPSADSENLNPGTNIELPFWLADTLHFKRPVMVTVDIPKVYKESYREILKADACAVDLHKLGLFYYEFGGHLTSYDNKAEISESLVSTFRNRFRHLMDLSQNREPDPLAYSKLDRLEQRLLHDSQMATMALNSWCSMTTSPLQTAPMVDNHRKRKRQMLEEI